MKNDTNDVLTLNLTKDVPQNESAWASPEDLETERVIYTPDTPLGMVEVGPGKTGTVTNIKGHFPDGAQAVLRVYRGGRLRQRDLLSTKPGLDRLDLPLVPGKENHFVIRDYRAGLVVDPPK